MVRLVEEHVVQTPDGGLGVGIGLVAAMADLARSAPSNLKTCVIEIRSQPLSRLNTQRRGERHSKFLSGPSGKTHNYHAPSEAKRLAANLAYRSAVLIRNSDSTRL